VSILLIFKSLNLKIKIDTEIYFINTLYFIKVNCNNNELELFSEKYLTWSLFPCSPDFPTPSMIVYYSKIGLVFYLIDNNN
jgi:hypothetical protein